MSETNPPIRSLNGHTLVDQEARDMAAQNATGISKLSEDSIGLSEEVGKLSRDIGTFADDIATKSVIASTNLLNMDALIDGMLPNSQNGEVDFANSSYWTTDFIFVPKGKTIRLQYDWGGKRCDATENPNYGDMSHIYVYDANKAFVEKYPQTSLLYFANAYDYDVYVRCAFDKRLFELALLSNPALVYGDTAAIVPYEEYHEPYTRYTIKEKSISPSKTTFFEQVIVESTNKLDINAVQYGKIPNGSGVLTDNTSYNTSNLISLPKGETIRFQYDWGADRVDATENPNYGGITYIALYNADGSYIRRDVVSNAASYKNAEGSDIFVRVIFSNFFTHAKVSKQALVYGDTAKIIPYEEYFEPYFVEQIPSGYVQEKPDAIRAFLPDEICVAVGRTIELYNSQVCLNAGKYHFGWNCAVGSALRRKFSVTGTESLIGNHVLSLSIYDDDMNTLWYGETTIKIVPAYTGAMRFLPLGDSLTNGKAWLAEVQNLCETITTVGTRGGSVKDADGEWRSMRQEGRSGFSAENYLTKTAYTYESEGVHPFWDDANQRFNWAYYVANSLGGVSPDAVVIWLGTNGKGNSLDAAPNVADIKQIIDYIRQDDANIKIYVMLPMFKGTQDGIGYQQNVDGYATSKGKWKYEEDMKVYNLLVCLHDALKGYTNLYMIPATQCHDSEYNYQTISVPVNPRASQTEMRQNESVHPLDQGYYQIADILFGAISAHQDN